MINWTLGTYFWKQNKLFIKNILCYVWNIMLYLLVIIKTTKTKFILGKGLVHKHWHLTFFMENSAIGLLHSNPSSFKILASVWNIEKESSFFPFTVEQRYDFILFKAENYLSAEQLLIVVYKYIPRAMSLHLDWRFSSVSNMFIFRGVSVTFEHFLCVKNEHMHWQRFPLNYLYTICEVSVFLHVQTPWRIHAWQVGENRKSFWY